VRPKRPRTEQRPPHGKGDERDHEPRVQRPRQLVGVQELGRFHGQGGDHE
jgi:hypothetical protein